MPVAFRQSACFLIYRSYTGTHRCVVVALPGSVWAPVELRCRPGCSRRRPGCSRCRAGRCRFPGGAPVYPGSPRSSPMEPLFILVETRFIPVDPGSRKGAPPAS
ncbi:hypothetical protein DPMN_139043 [Dreissena polymorpha]|uniref:Uncharacterized protein n=1 Tax=Dreissena polymorpha TaxID=45954 RepID=A0A9D4GAW2_DREPO|nr:hypothetical protein DPMN_139043 [Dreissena polymorpha]